MDGEVVLTGKLGGWDGKEVAGTCHLGFRRPNEPESLPYSELWGIAQSPDIIRQHVDSGLFIDEGAFQNSLEALKRSRN
jgi:hypothetical protein